MNGLIQVTQNSPLTFLQGYFGRITNIIGDDKHALVEIEERAKSRFNMRTHKLTIDTVRRITDGEKTLVSELSILAWQLLNSQEKASAVKKAIQANFNEYYEGFETYICQGNGPEFLDAFVLETQFRKDTHEKYGAKAIFEELRYHTYLKDACNQFKVNNNYTHSMALLVTTLFPEIKSFFSIKKNVLEEVA